MRIGIDISQVVYGAGVSQYTMNLVGSFLKIDKKNEYVLFGGALRRLNDLNHFTKNLSGNFVKRFYPLSPTMLDFLWNRIHKMPIENFVGNVDVFHSSDWSQPPVRQARRITTIHDLVPVLYPESSGTKIAAVHKRRLEWVKREVDRVIAVSNATKSDIITYLGIPQEKISVIYEAPSEIFKPVGENKVGEIRKKYKLSGEYLLTVGTDPRKNIPRIVKAISRIPDAPALVVVGRRWDSLSRTVGEGQNIVWLDQVPLDDLPALYSGAQALLYTSLYEGFGLPILEAMACGCPVVTSNVSSMPEVAGDAAILVDPEDFGEIRRGIETVLRQREELIKRGFARVKQFSWEKAAKETLKVYESVISE